LGDSQWDKKFLSQDLPWRGWFTLDWDHVLLPSMIISDPDLHGPLVGPDKQ
jgi:hypothetical protein